MRVVVKMGEKVKDKLGVVAKVGYSGREKGGSEVWGNLFDEMPLRRFDGMEECRLGERWDGGGNGEGRCLGLGNRRMGMGEGVERSEFEGFGFEDFKESHSER